MYLTICISREPSMMVYCAKSVKQAQRVAKLFRAAEESAAEGEGGNPGSAWILDTKKERAHFVPAQDYINERKAELKALAAEYDGDG